MPQAQEDGYGIRDVVRRTGLSAPVVRMWERRYGAVVPRRTSSNRRFYSSEDLERLGLLQALTARGHAISTVANLPLDALRERLAEEDSGTVPTRTGDPIPPRNRLVVVGPGLETILSAGKLLPRDPVAAFEDLPSAAGPDALPPADLLVITTDTLFPETVATIRQLVTRCQALRTIVSYRFASSHTATALERSLPGLRLLPAPVTEAQLQRECVVQLNALREATGPAVVPPTDRPLPVRRFSPEQLTKLTRLPTTVECECPQHLAGLLQSLSAFEDYSRECEDRNPQDALLHGLLHRTTAHARHAMEEALQHLIETEGVRLD